MIKPAENTMVESACFDLHGKVGIQLAEAGPLDCRLVSEQLGLPATFAPANTDLVLRFADHVGGTPTERLIGRDDVAFTDDTFVLIRKKHRARVQIPFDQIGGRCELVFQRGSSTLPLLSPIVNVTAMARGILPLHASAFRYEGQGALVAGWARGGKTTSLLGFMAQGAEFISDDWAYVDLDNSRMYGLPKSLEVSDRQLAELPAYRDRVARGQRWRMRSAWMAEQVIERMAASRWGRNVVPRGVVQHLLPALQRRRSVEVSPQRLFGTQVSPANPGESPLDAIFFTMSHASSEVRVEPATPAELVERMALMLEQEYAELRATYRKFRFAFPVRHNDLLDNLEQLLRERLAGLLANTTAYFVYHPYPVRAEAMFEAMRRWLLSP